jgi:hypothetical protein
VQKPRSKEMSHWTEEEREEALKRRMQGAGVMDSSAAAALGGGGLRWCSAKSSCSSICCRASPDMSVHCWSHACRSGDVFTLVFTCENAQICE